MLICVSYQVRPQQIPGIFFCFRNADTVGREHVCERESERALYFKSKIYQDGKKQN